MKLQSNTWLVKALAAGSDTAAVADAGLAAVSVNATLTATGADVTDEGSVYSLDLGTNPTADFAVDWGDGFGAQILIHGGGIVSHVYADDADGPENATPHVITVAMFDGTTSTLTTKIVTVNNVAPTIALSGAASVETGSPYTLNLGAITDPGKDTVVSRTIHWGDGSSDTVTGGGDVLHTYAVSGAMSITVDLVDEDGSFSSAGQLGVTVNAPPPPVVHVGDAPLFDKTGTAWATAWSAPGVHITNNSDVTRTGSAWSAVRFDSLNSRSASGGDVFLGDLGVSGRSMPTSLVAQEIDGKEALRLSLDQDATSVSLKLSLLFMHDDFSRYSEGGRVRLFDAAGNLVGEQSFHAANRDGSLVVDAAAAGGFRTVELSAGAFDNKGNFVFGAYQTDAGGFGTKVFTDRYGASHGSDFLLDSAQFDLEQAIAVTGVAPAAADVQMS